MSDDEDPTAWLGDPVGIYDTGRGTVYVNVPPVDRRELVISLVDAREIDDHDQTSTVFVQLDLALARALNRTLDAAIGQLEEHADS